MGRTAAQAALLAGAAVLLLTLTSSTGLVPLDLVTVAALGLLVTAGAAAVGFASSGRDRRTALGGAALGLLPGALLAGYLAASDG